MLCFLQVAAATISARALNSRGRRIVKVEAPGKGGGRGGSMWCWCGVGRTIIAKGAHAGIGAPGGLGGDQEEEEAADSAAEEDQESGGEEEEASGELVVLRTEEEEEVDGNGDGDSSDSDSGSDSDGSGSGDKEKARANEAKKKAKTRNLTAAQRALLRLPWFERGGHGHHGFGPFDCAVPGGGHHHRSTSALALRGAPFCAGCAGCCHCLCAPCISTPISVVSCFVDRDALPLALLLSVLFSLSHLARVLLCL